MTGARRIADSIFQLPTFLIQLLAVGSVTSE